MPHLHSPTWSIEHGVARSFCSMKTKRFSGALPCPAQAGGAQRSARLPTRPLSQSHLKPIEGFCRVMKGTIGAGRCFGALQELYQRTRRVLMTHQERPIYAFHW